MKIGLVTLSLTPGGAERLILEQARYLQNSGHDVIVYPQKDDPDFRESIDMSDLSVRELPEPNKPLNIPKSNELILPKILRDLVREDEVEHLISHYKDIITYLATHNTNINYSCHVNGSPFWFVDNPALVPHSRKQGYNQKLERIEGHGEFQNLQNSLFERIYYEIREVLRKRALQNSEIVTTLTNQVASELRFCYGIDPKIISPGVSENWFELELNKTPQDIPDVDTDNMILNVGRLDERKRNTLLLRSFADFYSWSEKDNVTLVIGGSGEEQGQLRSLATKLDIEDSVVFAGYISEEELPKYYSAADILAHPAWVAYGLVPLEAYIMGTKVMISTDTMVREIIGEEPGVSVIPPDSKKWSRKFRELLQAPDHDPNISTVPTWKEFCKNTYHHYEELDIFGK